MGDGDHTPSAVCFREHTNSAQSRAVEIAQRSKGFKCQRRRVCLGRAGLFSGGRAAVVITSRISPLTRGKKRGDGTAKRIAAARVTARRHSGDNSGMKDADLVDIDEQCAWRHAAGDTGSKAGASRRCQSMRYAKRTRRQRLETERLSQQRKSMSMRGRLPRLIAKRAARRLRQGKVSRERNKFAAWKRIRYRLEAPCGALARLLPQRAGNARQNAALSTTSLHGGAARHAQTSAPASVPPSCGGRGGGGSAEETTMTRGGRSRS
eukprot:IDg12649t1